MKVKSKLRNRNKALALIVKTELNLFNYFFRPPAQSRRLSTLY